MSREKFEDWLQPYWSSSTFIDDDGEEQYRDEWVQGAWMGWQAAFKASEQKLSESRREFTAANATIHNLELKVAQVVAENAELNDDYRDTPALKRMGWPKTPATDAFLAEVRAQGVELFAQSLHVAGKGKHLYSEIAEKFAAQLRQGAEK